MSFEETEASLPKYKQSVMKTARNAGQNLAWLLGALGLALALPLGAGAGPQCSVGLNTSGYTVPHGDIALLHGSPLEIICVLDQTKVPGYNATHLRFYRGREMIEPQFLEILNDTVLKLHIDKPDMSDTMYYCKIQEETKENAVCLNHVTIGTVPYEVTNFNCLSRNWENLTCTWTPPHNFLKTSYILSYKLPGRAGRASVYNCPKEGPVEVDHKLSCYWDQTTDPLYRQPYQYYYFNLTAVNKFGNKTQNFEFNHYAHMKPNNLNNLQVTNKTSHSALLRWSIPYPMQNFPVGLVTRFVYRSTFDPKDNWKSVIINKNNRLQHNLTDLPYANVWYDVRVSIKSELALGDELWSDFASVTFLTLSKLPDRPPEIVEGSFVVTPRLESRDVIIYWKQIKRHEENGENFHYKVTLHVDGVKTPISSNTSKNTYISLKGLPWKELKFTVQSWNDVGGSLEKSYITVPARDKLLSEPISFTKIAYEDSVYVYELSWNPPLLSYGKVESYTIFWCDNSRNRPYQCEGHFEWETVPASVKIQNITVSDDKFYEFAIAANGGGSSSGMVWASCTVVPTKIIGKMKNIWINKVGASFIEVGWRLECSNRIGTIKGYRIFYCPIVSPYNKDCKEPVRNITVPGDPQAIHNNVTNLKPYTTYAIRIAVITKHGDGLQSEPLYNTTLEGQPSPPLNITITDLSNTRMLVSWKPPRFMNGVIRYYKVNYDIDIDNMKYVKVDHIDNYTEVVLHNLTGYSNYTVSVEACTVACSVPSTALLVRTAIGNPGHLARPTISFFNSSQVAQLSWKPPKLPGGTVDFYEVRVVEAAEDDKNETYIYNTTSNSFVIPMPVCQEKGIVAYFYSVRAINVDNLDDHGAASFSTSGSVNVTKRPFNDSNTVRYIGPWSENTDNICTKVPTDRQAMYWIIGVAIIIALVGMSWFSRSLWQKYKRMQDIGVSLPPGLEPVNEKDSKYPLSNWGSQVKHNKDHEKSCLAPSADEVSLLPSKTLHSDLLNKGNNRDMSGFSVNTDSTTLTVSSEEGKDQANHDGVQSEPHSTNSSLRLRNVSSGGSRPTSAGSSEPTTWNSPYTKRNSTQDNNTGIAPYSAVGAWTPEDYFSKEDANPGPLECNIPKGYVSFGTFGVDNSLNSGLTGPNSPMSQVPLLTSPASSHNQGSNGYVAISNLPPNKSLKGMSSSIDKLHMSATELPSGYVKTAPEHGRSPSQEMSLYDHGVPIAANPSGYVSVSDAMLMVKPSSPFTPRLDIQSPTETGYVKCDDIRPVSNSHLSGIMAAPESGYIKPGNPSVPKRLSAPPLLNEKINEGSRTSADYSKPQSIFPFKQASTSLEPTTPIDSPEAYCRFGWSNSNPQQFDYQQFEGLGNSISPLKMGDMSSEDFDQSSFQDMMLEESPSPEPAVTPATHYLPLNLPTTRH